MSFFDDRIDILKRIAVEASPAYQIFITVGPILAIVRVSPFVPCPPVNSHLRHNQDKMIDNEDSVQLSEYCFSVCRVLETVTQGMSTGDLSESVRTGLGGLKRCVDRHWSWMLPH